MRLPTPQELTFALALTVLRAANALLCAALRATPLVPSASGHTRSARLCEAQPFFVSGSRFATVARVACGAVLAGRGAFSVGYSVLLSPGLVQPHLRSSSNRRIETDRRQRRFATLAPSAHAGRWVA